MRWTDELVAAQKGVRTLNENAPLDREGAGVVYPSVVSKKARKGVPKKGGTKSIRHYGPRKSLDDHETNTTKKQVVVRKPIHVRHGFERGVLGEIKYLQATTHLVVPRAPFKRIVVDMLQAFQNPQIKAQSGEMKINKEALDALQYATEFYGVQRMEAVNLAAIHSGRVTALPKDFTIVKRIEETVTGTSLRALLDEHGNTV